MRTNSKFNTNGLFNRMLIGNDLHLENMSAYKIPSFKYVQSSNGDTFNSRYSNSENGDTIVGQDDDVQLTRNTWSKRNILIWI